MDHQIWANLQNSDAKIGLFPGNIDCWGASRLLIILMIYVHSGYGETEWLIFTKKMCEWHNWKSDILSKDTSH